MTKQYVVINAFTDLEDNNHVYRGGDFYPREGVTLNEARAETLLYGKNIRGERLIVEVVPHKEEPAYPIATGGGYYELSNGDKVQGKDKAYKAEAKLKSGDA